MSDLTEDPSIISGRPKQRQWLAALTLKLECRNAKTALVTNTHYGPLRVQRPFYPEHNPTPILTPNATPPSECCHIYILHPPGGMVLGDKLKMDISVGKKASALITTPSAGKVYGVKNNLEEQHQVVTLHADEHSSIEWLPQETIVFNGANARLTTKLFLRQGARAFIWDIVCLGRPASNERFTQGRCHQTLEIRQDEKLLLIERNRFEGGASLLQKPWGLNQCNTSGTLCATVNPNRDFVDSLLEELENIDPENKHSWGITQKNALFIARYMGNSSFIAREGFTHIWKKLRLQLNYKEPVLPRIWNT